MRTSTTLLTVGLLALGTTAQECRGNRTEFSSQDQLDELIQDCSVLADEIRLVNFEGTLELPSITNITRLSTRNSSITSARFPDLENISEYLVIRDEVTSEETLRNVSFPRLQHAENITLRFANEIGGVEFPELMNATNIRIINTPNLSFPALTNVTYLSIMTGVSNGFPNNDTETPKEISLPALMDAETLRVIGDVESFTAPNFTNADNLHLAFYGPAVELSLPKFSPENNNGALDFTGNIESLSLPKLRIYRGDFRISTTVPVAIDIGLQSVRELSLHGDIESVYLPLLQEYSKVEVSPTAGGDFDCGALEEKLEQTAGPEDENGEFLCGGGASGLVALGGKWMVGLAGGVYLLGLVI
ncbi:hypothetical protein BJY04DRAFT_223163 [Aspergillus karnatakaensis]|uniref:uncharacterized protein n=1 Tax=Aspergillus karnatakaensis TaxID=1810916 RepID=UPI003CCD8197